MKLSLFTTYTEAEKRNDPWKEALSCFNFIADEVIVTGDDWPYEFKWSQIGKYFQEGLENTSGDWSIRMDIDYFFHEKDILNLHKYLEKYENFPIVCFPQYQFFTINRFQVKTRLCIAINRKFQHKVKLNGGGDLCLATYENKLVLPQQVPNINIPIYQYDSTFRTKEIIKKDRFRFAKAWNREFGNFGSRGGNDEDLCFEAWFKDIKNKYPKHVNQIKFEDHPIFIKNKLRTLSNDQFGHSAFGLKDKWESSIGNYLRGYKSLHLDGRINNIKKFKLN